MTVGLEEEPDVRLGFREDGRVRQVNVLLVEDNDFTRSTVASALSAEGCVVTAAVTTAREAVVAAAQNSIDCAVIDLHLGIGPTGIDVAHALRRNDPELGIVILTSYVDPRLLGGNQRPLPADAVYLVKDDVHSTAQLREGIDEACALGGTTTAVPGRVPLTDSQVEVLRLVAHGMTNAEIARRRVVTERSVEMTISRIIRRLGVIVGSGDNTRALLIQAYFAMIGSGQRRSP